MHAFFEASFSPPNLDQDVLAVWVVFWGMYRHSRLIQRVHRETYQGYVQLLRGMLDATCVKRGAPRTPAVDLRLAAIGLTALLDGLWLEWCLEPGNFRPAEAVALCETWVDNLVPSHRSIRTGITGNHPQHRGMLLGWREASVEQLRVGRGSSSSAAASAGCSPPRPCSRTPADVLVIDRNNYHLFQPLLYQVASRRARAGGHRAADPHHPARARRMRCVMLARGRPASI